MQSMNAVFAVLVVLLPTLAAADAIETLELKMMDDISKEGVEVVAGMVGAFLHRGKLSKSEVHCMFSDVQNATHLLHRASADVASASLALLGPSGTMAQAAVAAADLLLLVPQLEESIDKLLDLFGGFFGPCIGGTEREALDEASRHLGNLTYVAGHLQANGADIVRELGDAHEAFEKQEFMQFGKSIGRACRKVLLSKTSSRLPEGPPSLSAIANLTAGVLRGFFGRGFELDIYSADQDVPPASAEKTVVDFGSFVVNDADAEVASQAPVALHIDLHKCVKANLKYFQPALLDTLEYLARQDLASDEDAEEAFPDLVMTVMDDGPTMLSKCGLGKEELAMLEEAALALGSMHVQLRLPRAAASAPRAGPVAELQQAAEDWKALDWFALGEDLGQMLLQTVAQVFPQKYAVDPAGALSQRLPAPAAPVQPGLLVGLPLLLLGAAGGRSWQVLAARCGSAGRRDLENGGCEGAAE